LNFSLTFKRICRSNSVDKKEETTNSLNDKKEQGNLVGSTIKVRILPENFLPTDITCQRLALLHKYEELQKAMNEHYSSNSNASLADSLKDVTCDILNLNVSSVSSRKSSASLADSLEDVNSDDTCDILKQMLKVGDYCAAQFAHAWVRCKIIEIKSANKTCYIECVDDGRTQRTSLNKLQTLREDFRILPKFALKCKLSQLNDSVKLISLNIKAIDAFKRFISEASREFTAEIKKFQKNEDNQIFEIELYFEGKNIIEMLTCNQ
jgi:hypothetical protein